jgi:hypothetical protein
MNADDGIHTKGGEVSMSRKGMRLMAALLVLLSMVPASAWAFGGQEGGGRWGIPKAAIEACKEKSEGTAVEFFNRRGEKVKATCRQLSGRLAAVPEGGFRGPKGSPAGEEPGMSSEASRQPLKNRTDSITKGEEQ